LCVDFSLTFITRFVHSHGFFLPFFTSGKRLHVFSTCDHLNVLGLHFFFFITWEELNNNYNNSKVDEKTMTRISKVRSIIITISNPSGR
jgi:hypothetical protein